MREIGEGAIPNLPAFAVALTREGGGSGGAVGDDGDVHANFISGSLRFVDS